MRAAALLAVYGACIWAAEERIDSPVIGHVFDANVRAIRSVTGIPGSARMTDVLPFEGIEIQQAWMAPGRSYGLAGGTDGKLYRIDVPARSAIEIAAAVPEQVVWSTSGTSAALRYSTGDVRAFSKFDTKPEPGLQAVMDVNAGELAISDDGGVLVSVIPRDSARTLVVSSGGNDQRTLLSGPGLKNAAFLFGSRDLVVSDDAEGKIYSVRESGQLSVLAEVDDASAIAVAHDNSRVFVASARRKTVTTITIPDGFRTVDDCLCAPGVFYRLQADVFGVTDSTEGPLWLFNGASPQKRFTFVPQPEGTRE